MIHTTSRQALDTCGGEAHYTREMASFVITITELTSTLQLLTVHHKLVHTTVDACHSLQN